MTPTANLPPAPELPSLVVTATLDGHAVLHFDGRDIRMDRLLLADQRRLVAGLAHALHLVLTHQPGPTDLVQALDGIETLAGLRDPAGASTTFAPVREAIAAAHAALKAGATTHFHA